ncbi:MAG: hypothetical protein IIC93_06995 [Chloroflexi bacterium]|nr:hypothetical protein [Chloroflexota bacterium]
MRFPSCVEPFLKFGFATANVRSPFGAFSDDLVGSGLIRRQRLRRKMRTQESNDLSEEFKSLVI